MHPRCCRPTVGNIVGVHYTTSCNTQSSALEDGQINFPKHVELTGIINKPLLLHLVGCLYYLHQWCSVKQISGNEIYLLIQYIKSVPWRVSKRLSYIEDAWCLQVKWFWSLMAWTYEYNVTQATNPSYLRRSGEQKVDFHQRNIKGISTVCLLKNSLSCFVSKISDQ